MKDMEINKSTSDSLYMLQSLYDKHANHLAMLKKQVNEIHEEQGKIFNTMVKFFFMKYDKEFSFKKDQIEVTVCFLFSDGTKVTIVSNASYTISGIESDREENSITDIAANVIPIGITLEPSTMKSFLRKLSMEEPKIVFIERTFRNYVDRVIGDDFDE